MKKILLITAIFSISLLADFSRDDSSKIVTDSKTSLQWQDNESTTKIWIDAVNYCENLRLGGYDDWRLPNINELNSIVDDTKYMPCMSSAFKSLPPYHLNDYTISHYWSSTTSVDDSLSTVSFAWGFKFGDGYQGRFDKRYEANIRCTRSGLEIK